MDDADVVKCLKLLTFVPVEQIEAYEGVRDGRINEAKELLAYEITKEVHGEAEAARAQETGARAVLEERGREGHALCSSSRLGVYRRENRRARPAARRRRPPPKARAAA